MKTPANEGFLKILRRLYSPEDAELILKMPWGQNGLQLVAAVTGLPPAVLRPRLEALADRGLLVDLRIEEEMKYAIPPMILGFFEYTMMRSGPDADSKALSGLYHEYLEKDDSFWAGNFGHGNRYSPMRTIPHESSVATPSPFRMPALDEVGHGAGS